MIRPRLSLGMSLLGVLLCCVFPAISRAENHRLFVWPAQVLAENKVRLAAGAPSLQPALRRLVADADKALATKPVSVMDKPLTGKSGDKHDYFSLAPYWWPDPAKPDGLPYLRRDGELNPASKTGTDSIPLMRTCRAVFTLALAHYLTGKDAYAAHAALLTRVWFLDPATRMNPHLEYGQAIPGSSAGRGIGIIETRELVDLTEGLALLEGSPAWTAVDKERMQAWLGAYLDWLLTSAHGRTEKGEHNNHGTYYDMQVVHLALVLGRTELARSTVREAIDLRLVKHIAPDGSQPHEMARTRSLSYSTINLRGLLTLAIEGGPLDVDWWSRVTPEGAGLRKAIDFLLPYTEPEAKWIKKTLDTADRSNLRELVALASVASGDAGLRDRVARLQREPFLEERWNLFVPPATGRAAPAERAEGR